MIPFHSFLFRVLSQLWSLFSQIFRKLAHWGFYRSMRVNARVISVGNIQVGGAGKTPLVAKIAQEILTRGKSVCILCRGYSAQWEKTGGVIAPDSAAIAIRFCGDEAALLHALVPKAWIGVGAKRFQVYEQVLQMAYEKIDYVLLDDGFQNHQFKKDLEILAMTSAQPGEVLFRDAFSTLRYADLIVWTKGEKAPNFQGRPWVQIQYVLPTPPVLQRFFLVTGVADGTFVYRLSVESGYEICKHFSFPDHFQYDRAGIQSLLQEAQKAGCKIALTGKDWVKWKSFGVSEKELMILEPRLIFLQGEDIWNKIFSLQEQSF